MSAKSKTTTYEVLLAELLGDVGKLHDEIKRLPNEVDEISERILKSQFDQSKTLAERIVGSSISHVKNEHVIMFNDIKSALKDHKQYIDEKTDEAYALNNKSKKIMAFTAFMCSFMLSASLISAAIIFKG